MGPALKDAIGVHGQACVEELPCRVGGEPEVASSRWIETPAHSVRLPTLRALAPDSREAEEPVTHRSSKRGLAGRSHPGFVDMTGQTVAGVKVLERLTNIGGSARWQCRCECGATFVVLGFALRASDRAGTRARCSTCRPRRTGIGSRRAPTPKRPGSARICRVCANLPHRVTGLRCRSCNLLRGDE